MFVDVVDVFVKGGNGGDGIVAFRREKFVPKGGPAGGNGGQGGDVVFKVDEALNTLMDFRYQRHLKAAHGENGMSKGKHGKDADPLVVPVPPGTIVYDSLTNTVIADLTTHGEEAVIARGGIGGRGNAHFATARNPAPHLSENGEPGEEKEIRIELKLIADVGLVGLPNVGKSTLLSVVTAAKPKIDNYHFTTLSPNLGVVNTENHRSFVLADLPGLIEGAHEGVGLGHQFLRHIERTRVLLHVIDMSRIEGRDPYDDFVKINDELKQYDPTLMERPQIIVANKMDMPEAEKHLEEFRHRIDPSYDIYPISALTREGLRQLLFAIVQLLDTIPKEQTSVEPVVIEYEKKDDPFTITRADDGAFVLSGNEVERLFKMTNFGTKEGMRRFARQLRHLGVDEALRELGAVDGSIVRLLDFEFEFIE